jgi:predicted RNA-binding Zn ribbon-like protein
MADEDGTPPGLRQLSALVNTAVLTGADDLTDPEVLAAWAREHALAPPEQVFTEADLERVRDFREGVRRLLLAHNGEDLDPGALTALQAARRDVELAVTFAADGSARLEPAGAGVDGLLGRLLGSIVEAQANGTWPRLKACRSETCGWAFYDRSRNHSRTWCDMSDCGNRAKARRYRARHAH